MVNLKLTCVSKISYIWIFLWTKKLVAFGHVFTSAEFISFSVTIANQSELISLRLYLLIFISERSPLNRKTLGTFLCVAALLPVKEGATNEIRLMYSNTNTHTNTNVKQLSSVWKEVQQMRSTNEGEYQWEAPSHSQRDKSTLKLTFHFRNDNYSNHWGISCVLYMWWLYFWPFWMYSVLILWSNLKDFMST